MNKIIWFTTIVLLVTSCYYDDEYMDYYANNFEPELSLTGFVCADSIYACLTKTKKRQFNSIYEKGYYDKTITDTSAVAIVYEDGKYFCTLTTKQIEKYDRDYNLVYQKKYYVSYKKIKEGKSYSIKIKHEKFGIIEATTNLPKVPVVTFDTVSVLRNIEISFHINEKNVSVDTVLPYKKFTLSINDFPSVSNYYMVELYDLRCPENHEYITSQYCFNDLVIENGAEKSYLKHIFSDKLFDGKSYDFQFFILKECSDRVWVNLYYISEEQYNYYMSVDDYKIAEADLFSKPVLLYSNVSNSIGIWGGYFKETFKNY